MREAVPRSPIVLSNEHQVQVGQGRQRVCVLPMFRDSSFEEKPEGKGSTWGWVGEAPSTEADNPSPTSGLPRMLTCPQRTSLCKLKFQRKT